MSLSRWNQRLPNLFRRRDGKDALSTLDQFFQNLEHEFGALATPHTSGLTIASDEKNIYVEAAVPGLTAAEIDVSIDNEGVLWIKGEKIEEETKEKEYYRKAQSTYSYCVPLWDEVDTTVEPQASCKNGVMVITFPKKQEKQKEAKKIQVKEEK